MKGIFTTLLLSATFLLPAQDTLHLPATHAAYDAVDKLLLIQMAGPDSFPPPEVIATPTFTATFPEAPALLRFDSSYQVVTSAAETLTVAFTPLPLFQIHSAEEIIREGKVPGSISYAFGADSLTSPIGVRYRGSFTLRYPKKSLDLEFREWQDRDESRDVQFLDLREDDDWVLDALYNEPSRVNAYVGHKLWLDLHSPSYATEEPKARAGADVAFAELFLNGRYHGLYMLSEQVDRSQLKLKKYDDDAGVRGELYKSEEYTIATSFQGVPNETPVDDDWAGWEVKHPDEDEVDWDRLRQLIRFVANTPDAEFRAAADQHFDLENLIDYLLFVNGLSLTDNMSKNTYLARYDTDYPYFFAPWDLDAGLGNRHDGTRQESATTWRTNQLFTRLSELDAADFNQQLCNRYTELRTGLLRPDSLEARVTNAMDVLQSSGAYRREARRWPELLDFSEDQVSFTHSFIQERIDFLDGYVCNLSTPTTDPLLADAQALRVYPNPSRAYLMVEGIAGPAPYGLYSVAGRRVLSGELFGPGRIALPELPAGLYFLRVGRQLARVVIGG
ncbi:hypothetical protein GGR26_002595 [Lewinella marina]|uniref:Spore coat protein CotH n=1 Tax=Neolewinella marina TaxID=438751 RepID=A0A2G0CB38_9BACT|nr:CotH kinase family protein [Neolewinella marina]NJB86818.1 hypothetical protein [Neolewinella marina]PHK97172.1 hypothetical protein CGL56_17170 [Neolewinella marina]